MLKRTINYEDYDGNPQSRVYHFNLTKAELVELEASVEGGLEKRLQEITEAVNVKELIALFKQVILISYGVREGDRFVKNDEVRDAFTQTPAYSALFMELATDANAAADFMNGLLPRDLATPVQQDKPLSPPPPPPGGNV
jgi:hypothetical protein